MQQKVDLTVGEGVTIRPLNITVVNKHMPPPLRCNALLVRQNEDRETNKASSAGAASSNNVVSGPSKTSFRPPPPTSKPPVALLPKSSSAAGVEKNISARNSHRTDNNITTNSDKSIASTVAKKSPKVKINFNALPTVTIASDTRSGDLLAFRYLRLCEKTFSPVLSEFVQARVVRVTVNGAGVISLEMVVTRIDPADDSYLPGEEVVLVWAEMSDVKVVSRELEITDNEIPNELISSHSNENPGAVCTVVETQSASVPTSDAMNVEENPDEEEEEEEEGFSLFDLFASDLERKKRSLEEVTSR
jgi:ribosomal protein L12E/L44/L45/RPP1/RPP2